jgi:hypothetical protein
MNQNMLIHDFFSVTCMLRDMSVIMPLTETNPYVDICREAAKGMMYEHMAGKRVSSVD